MQKCKNGYREFQEWKILTETRVEMGNECKIDAKQLALQTFISIPISFRVISKQIMNSAFGFLWID